MANSALADTARSDEGPPVRKVKYAELRQAIAKYCLTGEGLSTDVLECLRAAFFSDHGHARLWRWIKAEAADICDLPEEEYERMDNEKLLKHLFIETTSEGDNMIKLGEKCHNTLAPARRKKVMYHIAHFFTELLGASAASFTRLHGAVRNANANVRAATAAVHAIVPPVVGHTAHGVYRAVAGVAGLIKNVVVPVAPAVWILLSIFLALSPSGTALGCVLMALEAFFFMLAMIPRYEMDAGCASNSGKEGIPSRFVFRGGLVASFTLGCLYSLLRYISTGTTFLSSIPEFVDSLPNEMRAKLQEGTVQQSILYGVTLLNCLYLSAAGDLYGVLLGFFQKTTLFAFQTLNDIRFFDVSFATGPFARAWRFFGSAVFAASSYMPYESGTVNAWIKAAGQEMTVKGSHDAILRPFYSDNNMSAYFNVLHDKISASLRYGATQLADTLAKHSLKSIPLHAAENLMQGAYKTLLLAISKAAGLTGQLIVSSSGDYAGLVGAILQTGEDYQGLMFAIAEGVKLLPMNLTTPFIMRRVGKIHRILECWFARKLHSRMLRFRHEEHTSAKAISTKEEEVEEGKTKGKQVTKFS